MPNEFYELIEVLGSGLIIGVIFVVPVVIWRLIRRKPILPYKQPERMESSIPIFTGILMFGGFCLGSFLTGKIYFGSAFFILFLAFVFPLIAYKKGKI